MGRILSLIAFPAATNVCQQVEYWDQEEESPPAAAERKELEVPQKKQYANNNERKGKGERKAIFSDFFRIRHGNLTWFVFFCSPMPEEKCHDQNGKEEEQKKIRKPVWRKVMHIVSLPK